MTDAPGEWLLEVETAQLEPAALLEQFAERLNVRGYDLVRASLWLPTLHPELWGSQLIWTSGHGIQALRRPHETSGTASYLNTPGKALHDGAARVRCRLDVPRESLPFPILSEVADLGATDYTAFALRGAAIAWVTFATRRGQGFSDAQLAELEALVPVLRIHTQLAISRVATRSLLDVYLGANAAQHVLAGQFRRGTGVTVSAAVWFCDLRGFTAVTDRLPGKEVVALLDRYFEAIAGPIEAEGGEILKFIGDAALAIFPVSGRGAPDACRGALAAAQGALAAVEEIPNIDIGVGLHLGEVLYGNIGGRRRLDFTVIGSTVNEVCRVESLCKELKANLLMTRVFADALPGVSTVSLGAHVLRGVVAPQELCSLPEFLHHSA